MEEFFGNDFEEDFFEEFSKKSRAEVELTPNWISHMCEPMVCVFSTI